MRMPWCILAGFGLHGIAGVLARYNVTILAKTEISAASPSHLVAPISRHYIIFEQSRKMNRYGGVYQIWMLDSLRS